MKSPWRSKMTTIRYGSANWKTNLLLLAVTLPLAGCQSLPSSAVCPPPKQMPELVAQPVPTKNQLDAMKKRIERFETNSSSPAR